ncbi:uncharacterized protein SOCE836_098640 [Sorangium cellulosum]|uniref:Uncharacterized protein n=1 Tax=Sorangium cellulosum TaxID=56 RepID=A0A4P2R3K1_SORCE|nr:uncharacterized protein SOCE836_098640 [Sorangium cellulosum]WCQ96924.1 hypothetical protein NQZ70_09714 [Sorangium sp. Soce836]
MLIVVRPLSAGQGGRAPSRRRPRSRPPSLNDTDAIRLTAALHNPLRLYGHRSSPAGRMGIRARNCRHTAADPHRASPAIAKGAAQATGTTGYSRLSAPGAADGYRNSERGG